MVWYSHLFQNFPQFIVIYTVTGFGIVNKAEIDVFLELSCVFNDPAGIGNLISGSSAFSQGWGNSKDEGSAAVTDTTCGRRSRRVGVAAAEGAREGGRGQGHQRLPSSSKSKTQGMLYVWSLKKSVSVG